MDPQYPNWEQLLPGVHLVLATAPQVASLLSGRDPEDVGAGVAAVVAAGVAEGDDGVEGVELQTP